MVAAFLEPLSMAHAPRIQMLAGHPEVLATTLLPDPYPPDGGEVFAAYAERAFLDGRERIFAIMSVTDGLVGTCGLRYVSETTAELGYWVGRPYWGQGYGTFAARTIVSKAASFGFTKVIAFTLTSNVRSARTLEAAGFVAVGVFPNDKHDRWPRETLLSHYEKVVIDASGAPL